ESDRESETSTSSSSSSSSLLSVSLKTKKTIEYLDSKSYQQIKEIFIWCDSDLKDIYCIDEKITWVDQKSAIMTQLLPALCKKVDKKYNVSQQELLKMLYGRWRARHHEYNIKKQGDEQYEKNRRRKAKNSMKRQRRVTAVDYLLAMKDPHIIKYPQRDLVTILKDSGYHSEELRITSQRYIQQTGSPPIGASTWCLTNEALKKFNFPVENIPIYNLETTEKSNEDNDNEGDNNHDSDDNNIYSK
ncbi:4633_t:CDS:2, partial [Racocetra fulgida]